MTRKKIERHVGFFGDECAFDTMYIWFGNEKWELQMFEIFGLPTSFMERMNQINWQKNERCFFSDIASQHWLTCVIVVDVQMKWRYECMSNTTNNRVNKLNRWSWSPCFVKTLTCEVAPVIVQECQVFHTETSVHFLCFLVTSLPVKNNNPWQLKWPFEEKSQSITMPILAPNFTLLFLWNNDEVK